MTRSSDISDIYRPQVHFTPATNWMNDPNGLIYHAGEYHLFFQHNPFGSDWGHMSWGHAVSRDLVHWRQLPVAIPEENGIMIFSGSVVHDIRNTSGFGSAENSPLVAIYTGHVDKPRREAQHLAFSADQGRTWTKYAGNPVLDIGAPDFRDPQVFWYEPHDRWIMVVAEGTHARFYASADLKRWEHLSTFGQAGAPGVPNWECPDMFALPVDGDTEDMRWVLKIAVGDCAVSEGSGTQYFVGHFDGVRFRNENDPSEVLWVDHGADFYAAHSFNHIPEEDDRLVWLAWMSNWKYAAATPTCPWRGAMTFPREVMLTRTPAGIRLRQRPIPEIALLRGKPLTLRDWLVAPGEHPLNEYDVGQGAREICARFAPGDAACFGLHIREGAGRRTRIGYDAGKGTLFVDRTRSGYADFSEWFAGVHTAPLQPSAAGQIDLRIILDRSSVEVFGGDGEAVITDLIFPDPADIGMSLFAEGGTARLVSMDIFPLQSIRSNGLESAADRENDFRTWVMPDEASSVATPQ